VWNGSRNERRAAHSANRGPGFIKEPVEVWSKDTQDCGQGRNVACISWRHVVFVRFAYFNIQHLAIKFRDWICFEKNNTLRQAKLLNQYRNFMDKGCAIAHELHGVNVVRVSANRHFLRTDSGWYALD
jgi:hypothetical protein